MYANLCFKVLKGKMCCYFHLLVKVTEEFVQSGESHFLLN